MAQKLGRYDVVRELGKGAMGVVYEATDPAIGRRLALKTILPQQGISTEEQEMRRERFQREAKAAGVLSHPNIVTIYDVGEDRFSGATFFAMEFIAGDDLSKVLRQRGPLPAEEVVSIVAQVADALDYAHRAGIVHRDVKPANIVLMPDGRVKVTDFGIAKLESSTLTQTGAYLGTPTFMAPEMISGRPLDGRADQFSLGVVTFQLLTNAKPFTGDNLATLSYQIVNRDPTPVRSHRPDLPPEVEAVFLKCLAKSAADRYACCNDFVRDLRAVLVPADEATLDYDERTRAAGPGSARVRTVGPGTGSVRTGPGTGSVRTVTGPGTGSVRTAARGADTLQTVAGPGADEWTRAAAPEPPAFGGPPSLGGRLEASQATVSTAPSRAGGVILGAAVGLALFLGLVVVALLWFFVLRKPGPVAGPVPATPPVTATAPATPSPSPTPAPPVTTPEPSPSLPVVATPDPAELERRRLNEERWKRAVTAYSAGRHDAAIKDLTLLVQDDPENAAARDLLDKATTARAAAEQARREELARASTPEPRPEPTKVAVATPEPRPRDPDPKPPDPKEPRSVEPAPEEEGAGTGSTLAIRFDHRLAGGTITVWVDGKKVLDDGFSGSDEAVVKFKPLNFSLGKESSYRKEVSVGPGSHDVKVSISGKGVNTTGTIGGKFKDGKTSLLLVGVGAVDRDIELEWD